MNEYTLASISNVVEHQHKFHRHSLYWEDLHFHYLKAKNILEWRKLRWLSHCCRLASLIQMSKRFEALVIVAKTPQYHPLRGLELSEPPLLHVPALDKAKASCFALFPVIMLS